MSEKTKSCNLTENEISYLLGKYGMRLTSQNFSDEDIDRINYLNKRLKTLCALRRTKPPLRYMRD